MSNKDMFVGVDPSYNGFGIIVIDGNAELIHQKAICTKTECSIEERIVNLEKEFGFIANIFGLRSVYIEGPSYSSNGKFILQMGALHYYLRIFLYKQGINYTVVSPGTLKKFVTGSGNSKKDLILLKVFKKWGIEFDDNNLADAYGLARMALEAYKNDKSGKVPKKSK